MSCSSPTLNEATESCEINDLADAELEEILKCLPPYERLIVSEVCRRWNDISRKAWLDVKRLDLDAAIPAGRIAPIVKLCPNLQSVFVFQKSFLSNEITCLSSVQGLSTVKFYGCNLLMNDRTDDIVEGIFSENLVHSTWTELILNDPVIDVCGGNFEWIEFTAKCLPASLTHLQLSGLRLNSDFCHRQHMFLNGLERLENLECLIFHTTPEPHSAQCFDDDNTTTELLNNAFGMGMRDAFDNISTLKNLKELSVGPLPRLCCGQKFDLGEFISGMSKLEVLFLCDVRGDDIADDLELIITSNSVMRILVLSGYFGAEEPFDFAARKRFPRGFGSDPLPLLHVFVGNSASQSIRFGRSEADAAVIHPINQPMPEFLEREDIAPIFEGVWVAVKIKDAAKHGDGKLWDYKEHDVATAIQHF